MRNAPAVEGARRALAIHRTSVREAAILMLLAIGVGLAGAFLAVLLNISVHGAIAWVSPYHGRLWVILLPAAGAGLSAWYVRGLLRDESGHGVPELIRAATLRGGALRTSMIYSRLIASFLTVGSGGSAGLEGPIATSGGALGSALGRLLGFNERRRTLLLGYGVAGAIAAIFNAPLTGTVFALEVILGEWSALSILPTIVASVSATQFSRWILGNQIAFPHEVLGFSTLDLFACAVLGMGTGMLSVGFARGLTWFEHRFDSIPWPAWGRAALGGLIVGAIGYAMPEVLHDGYGVIQAFLGDMGAMARLTLLAFILFKFAACCITLGSGGSGGIFAPSLVLGSATGFGFGALLQRLLPAATLASPSAYALVGMAGMVAGLMHAPLTGMFLVLEVTGGYRLILPLMIAAVLAMLVNYYFDVGSVYTRELIAHGAFARRGSDLHLLQTMQLRELMDAESAVVYEDMLLGDFIEVFKRARRNIFPVVERETGRWLGIVHLDEIRPYLFDQTLYPIMTMGEIMHTDAPTIESSESALSAIQKFETTGAWSLPVVEDGRFLGMMSKSTLFDRYRRELVVHTQE
jgi:CIC family chloride channel protein